MKTSTKFSFLLAAFSSLTFSAMAQTTKPAADGIRYSVGVESGITTGSFRNAYDWNLGGSIQADIPVVSQLYVTANAGYNNFFSKDQAGASATDLHLIPVKAGLKYFPISGLYVQGEAGAAFAINKSDVGLNRNAAFIYAPQIGVLIPLGGTNALDAGVRYEGSTQFNSAVNNSKVNYFGLRVAYAFGL